MRGGSTGLRSYLIHGSRAERNGSVTRDTRRLSVRGVLAPVALVVALGACSTPGASQDAGGRKSVEKPVAKEPPAEKRVDRPRSLAADASAPLPFDPLPTATLRASRRKAVAHFHCPWPRSIDNKPGYRDYYTNGFLSPDGEGGKHSRYGGYIRQRPYPITPTEKGESRRHADQDIREAIAMGLDAFIVNFVTDTDKHQFPRAMSVLDAAARVDPGFRIIPSPDCVCKWRKRDVRIFIEFLDRIKDHPSLMRMDDRIVLSPWGAHMHPPEFWREVIEAARAEGIEIAFLPCPHGIPDTWLKGIAPLCVGLMDSSHCDSWNSAKHQGGGAERVHRAGVPIYVQTIRTQDGRPKANIYWEAANSRLFRESWKIALERLGPADWVQFFTWNDHAEFSGMMPGTGIQYAFYDMARYYVTWFKTGAQPPIVRDVLYYVYRVHSTGAQPMKGGDWKCRGGGTVDEIELVAFLAAPGRIAIELAGKRQFKDVPAGISALTVPLVEGTPAFTLTRDGRETIRTRGRFTIGDRIMWDDMMYYAGSSSREPNLARLRPEPSGMVLDLRCNETWGPYVYDASDRGNHGLLGDIGRIAHATGRDGEGLYVPARAECDAAVTVEDSASLKTEHLTVAAWIRPEGVTAARIIAREQSPDGGGYALLFQDGVLALRVADATRRAVARAPFDAARGDWQFVAGTFDGSRAVLYLDGRAVASAPAEGVDLSGAGGDVRIGAGFHGWIDEVRVYDRALSAEEIGAVHANYSGPPAVVTGRARLAKTRPIAPVRVRRAPRPSADGLTLFDGLLRERIRAAISSGQRIATFLPMLRQKVRVTETSDTSLSLVTERGRMQVSAEWSRLGAQDRRSLAVAAVRDGSPEDHAIAAFFCLAAGDDDAGAEHRARAGEYAALVESAFASTGDDATDAEGAALTQGS